MGELTGPDGDARFPKEGAWPLVKAYILVVTDPGATKRVFDALAAVNGVSEIHEVMGPYDIILELDVPNLADVPPILSSSIRTIQGIQSTTSLVSFPSA
jgi:DNA-binding Lrp family transcriptional regulator